MSGVKVWVVRDPSRLSTLQDIVWETDARTFGLCCLGGPETLSEHPAFHLTREAAEADARARFLRFGVGE